MKHPRIFIFSIIAIFASVNISFAQDTAMAQNITADTTFADSAVTDSTFYRDSVEHLMAGKVLYLSVPVNGMLTVYYKSEKVSNANIFVLSKNGTQVYKNSVLVNVGINRFLIDLKSTAKETYLILIKGSDETKTAQLIID